MITKVRGKTKVTLLMKEMVEIFLVTFDFPINGGLEFSRNFCKDFSFTQRGRWRRRSSSPSAFPVGLSKARKKTLFSLCKLFM